MIIIVIMTSRHHLCFAVMLVTFYDFVSFHISGL